MILELLEAISVFGDRSGEILCKFCYGDEELTGWLRPCKCSGTLKWVHKSCFDIWMTKAPVEQQAQCQTCKHIYDKQWVLKPFRDWSWPSIKFRGVVVLEILLDAYSTFKFIRGFLLFWKGQRSVWAQALHFLFWRVFIATNRRCAYYRSLVYVAVACVFEIQVQDYDPKLRPTEVPYAGPTADEFVNPRPAILAHVPVNPAMELIKQQLFPLAKLFLEHRDRLITITVGIILPVVVMAIILNWRIHQTEKKKMKQIKNKEKLIKFLKGGKSSLGSLEKCVKLIKSSVGNNEEHEKQE